MCKINDIKDHTKPPLGDFDPMPFGVHKGKAMHLVPLKYLEWMVQETIDFPRMSRPYEWRLVIDYIKSKAKSHNVKGHL